VGTRAEVAVPDGARTLGGPGRFIVPGLIDGHVHFFQSGGLYTRPDVVDLRARVPYLEEARHIEAALPDTLRRYLRAGITGVIDFGGPNRNFSIRELAAHTELAPRVAVAGPLLSPEARPQFDPADLPFLEVREPAAARAAVREQARHAPDFIKLWWRLGPGETFAAWQAVARAAIEEAHALGLRVAVHATQLETARAAVLTGADVLVHSVTDAEVDDAFVALLLERHVPYVSTLSVFSGYRGVLGHAVRFSEAELELADPAIAATVVEPSPEGAERYRRPLGPEADHNLRRLQAAGVLVVAGSDAGNIGTFHAAGLHRELERLVSAGLTPAQALAAATTNAARLLRRDDLGRVAPGTLADLLVLTADPLHDVRNTRRIEWVLKGGVAHRPEDILPRTAADVVQAQLNAYNAQDLEGFLATYADEAVLLRGSTGERLAVGKAALRERYGAVFSKFPLNRARISERRTEGDRVVLDREIVTGRGPDKPDPWDVGWVRYEVEGGLIRAVTLP
jgi:imidazolonepropionase-like amidohydrolase